MEPRGGLETGLEIPSDRMGETGGCRGDAARAGRPSRWSTAVAKETVVDAHWEFYQAFMPTMRHLHQEYGPLYLGIVAQFGPESENGWTLLVGSRTLARDAANGVEIVARSLSELAPPEVARTIRRIGIIHESDPVFLAIAKVIRQPLGGPNELVRVNLLGLHIERAGVFASVQDVSKLHSEYSKRQRPTSKRRRPPRR